MIKNASFIFAALLVMAGSAWQPEKKVQLPPVNLQQFNLIGRAFEECDCPQKSTGALWQSFLQAVKEQHPEWLGLKPDSTQKKGGKP